MSTTVEVRGVTATWDGSSVSFSNEGASISPVSWSGPDPERPNRRNLFMPDPYEDTGFAEAVWDAFKEAGV